MDKLTKTLSDIARSQLPPWHHNQPAEFDCTDCEQRLSLNPITVAPVPCNQLRDLQEWLRSMSDCLNRGCKLVDSQVARWRSIYDTQRAHCYERGACCTDNPNSDGVYRCNDNMTRMDCEDGHGGLNPGTFRNGSCADGVCYGKDNIWAKCRRRVREAASTCIDECGFWGEDCILECHCRECLAQYRCSEWAGPDLNIPEGTHERILTQCLQDAGCKWTIEFYDEHD